MTRSLLISPRYFPPQVGGISHFGASIATALGRERVCCLTGVAATGGPDSPQVGCHVYRRPGAFAGGRYQQGFHLGMALAEIMLRERPRVVQLAMADDGYLGLLLQRWFGLPFVVYAYGNEILEAERSLWEKPRAALWRADAVIAVSRYTGEMLERLGVESDRIAIVHPGCDADHFRPRAPDRALWDRLLGGRPAGRVILTVGTLVARKGQDSVIRALPALRERVGDVTYVIVGLGPYQPELERLASALGVREHVVFAGRVPDRSLPEYYSRCDVFVMPSRDQHDTSDVEGFGMVYLEANACGRPVVGGASGGIADAVVDGVTGFLVEPHDGVGLVDVLARLLSDPALAERLGRAGRDRVVRQFSWTGTAERVQAIIDGVARSVRDQAE